MIRDDMGFWKCPRCGGEFWDDESKLAIIRERESVIITEERLRSQIRWSLSKRYTDVPPLVVVIDPSSRGSRSSSKRKKPLPKNLFNPYLTI
jgi:Zn-finger nucleic acid-binding protein